MKRQVSVPEANGKLTIDGILNEAAWQKAAIISDFANFMEFKEKLLAKPADPATEVRLLQKFFFKTPDGKLLFNIGRYRGHNPTSGLTQVHGRGGWFCEQYWAELKLDQT